MGPALVLEASDPDQVEELLEDWFQAEPKSRRTLGIRDEVRDARDDADVGFRPDAAKTLGKDHHLGAGQHLGTQHPRTIAAAHGVHVTLDVGVPDDGEDLVHV